MVGGVEDSDGDESDCTDDVDVVEEFGVGAGDGISNDGRGGVDGIGDIDDIVGGVDGIFSVDGNSWGIDDGDDIGAGGSGGGCVCCDDD